MGQNSSKFQGSLAEYEIFLQDGQYFIRYRDEKIKNGDFLPLISERDPEKEAQRIIGRFDLKEGLLAIVVGASALKVIEILKKKRQSNGGEILVFEADPGLFFELKKKAPHVFEDVCVVIPGNENALRAYMEKLPIEGLLGYRVLPLARSFQMAPEYYTSQENIFKSVFSSRFSDLFTRIEFEGKWILNSFLNLEALLRAIPVRSLFNIASGENALLVSSGPSLRQSLGWIKKNQNRYFIACVDSAYRVLSRSGIQPHLIFSLDSQIFTQRHFQGLPAGDPGQFPVLYADMVSNPWVIRNWQGNLLMGVTAHYSDTHRVITPGCDFIEDEFLDEPCGDIQSGGSVATSLFDLLRNMNFQSITLVGQDLAFTNREIHCTGTHHTDIWLTKKINRFESFENLNFKIIKKRQIVWSTSIQGNALPEDYVFSIYRKWFEESIAKIPNTIMNATVDGAVIHGLKGFLVPEKPLSVKFLEKFSKTVFQGSKASIKRENLVKFYTNIVRGNPFDASSSSENFPFLERIGKKYYIKHLRNNLRGNDPEGQVDSRYLRLQLRDKKIFWDFLKKRIGNSLKKIE